MRSELKSRQLQIRFANAVMLNVTDLSGLCEDTPTFGTGLENMATQRHEGKLGITV
jgi:hypothetical protein